MSKNIILNGETFNNASYIKTETVDGTTALFRESSEIVTPSGSTEITENGTFDVTNFAQALVNVAGGGGTIQPITGFYTVKAKTLIGVSLPIGEVNASKFLVCIQLVETGTYAISGDDTSELTMDDVVTGFGTNWTLCDGVYFAGLCDESIEHQQDVFKLRGTFTAITGSNKMNNCIATNLTVTYSDGKLNVSPTGQYLGSLNKYCKYAYTVYPLG